MYISFKHDYYFFFAIERRGRQYMFSFVDSWSTEVDIRCTGHLLNNWNCGADAPKKGVFRHKIGHSGETEWDRLAGMFSFDRQNPPC
jgi:hypothetical protein